MALVKQYNKKTGTTYVYDSHSYWDKERKQHRSDRKLIGKIDPETGEIVPTKQKKKAEARGDEESRKEIKSLESKLKKYETELDEQKAMIRSLKEELRKKDQILSKIRAMTEL